MKSFQASTWDGIKSIRRTIVNLTIGTFLILSFGTAHAESKVELFAFRLDPIDDENLLIPEPVTPPQQTIQKNSGPSLTDALDGGPAPPPAPPPPKPSTGPSVSDLLDAGNNNQSPASTRPATPPKAKTQRIPSSENGNLDGIDPDTLQPIDETPPTPATPPADARNQATPAQQTNTLSPTPPAAPPKPDNDPIPDSEILPYDPELDEGSSPSPNADNPTPSEEDSENQQNGDQAEMDALIAHDTKTIEKQMNWINLGLGYVLGNSPLGLPYYFPAINIKYTRILKNVFFIKNEKLQDALAFEVSSYFFKAINFAAEGDAYNVASLSGSFRYDLIFSEAFRIFFYAGAIQGFLISKNDAQQSAVNALTLLQPAFGGGLLFQLGPGWYTRLDLGWDNMGFGLSLKF